MVRLVVSNARIQAEASNRVHQVDLSRRRLVVAADESAANSSVS
jgi:hypothetical protein